MVLLTEGVKRLVTFCTRRLGIFIFYDLFLEIIGSSFTLTIPHYLINYHCVQFKKQK